MSREQLLARAFVELADTLVDDFEVLDFLEHLTVRSVQITGADAAALVLNDQRGELQIVTSTTHQAAQLEVVALATRRGPCLDAVSTGLPVVNTPPADAEARWPDFSAVARTVGLESVHVFPMRLRTEVIGAMSLFYAARHTMSDDDVAVSSALTGVATISLLHERTVRQREVLAEHLQAALNDRALLEQAKGAVAEHLQVEVDRAYALISAHAARTGTTLTRVGRDLLEGRLAAGSLREGS